MKTIAVLTDDSKGAEHATRFALHMAKKMKASILLFSLCNVPAAKQVVLAGDQGPDPEDEPALDNFARRMHQYLVTSSFPGAYLPQIAVDGENTELVDVMTAISRHEDIVMVVTAPAPDNDLAGYVLSDACSRIIDWARVPVLVVPETAPLRNFEKIAFASKLHEEDIHSIAELGSLLTNFAAELMVAHLNTDPSNNDVRAAEARLNRELYQKLDCGGVYFRSIPDVDRQKNWAWLKANKRTDLLAVVQQPREQMTQFFTRGKNEEATYHLTLPVMILPKRP
jgi:hypothetical protein